MSKFPVTFKTKCGDLTFHAPNTRGTFSDGTRSFLHYEDMDAPSQGMARSTVWRLMIGCLVIFWTGVIVCLFG